MEDLSTKIWDSVNTNIRIKQCTPEINLAYIQKIISEYAYGNGLTEEELIKCILYDFKQKIAEMYKFDKLPSESIKKIHEILRKETNNVRDGTIGVKISTKYILRDIKK